MSKLHVGLWYEDTFEGLSNYSPWKERIKLDLQANRIWEFAKKAIKHPTNPKELEVYEELDMKARFIILDGMKGSLIPHLSRKNTALEMCVALQNLFQKKNKNWVLVLEDKLKSTKNIQGEGVTSYLTRSSEFKDELSVVSVTISDLEMVIISLMGV